MENRIDIVPISPPDEMISMGSQPTTSTATLPAAGATPDVLTEPTTDVSIGRFVDRPGRGSQVLLDFTGVADDGGLATFVVGVRTRRRRKGSPLTTKINQWNFRVKAAGTITFGTQTGIADGHTGVTERYADTIVLSNDGSLGPNRCRVIGRDGTGAGGANVADNAGQTLVFDREAGEFVEVYIKIGVGTTSVMPWLGSLPGI